MGRCLCIQNSATRAVKLVLPMEEKEVLEEVEEEESRERETLKCKYISNGGDST